MDSLTHETCIFRGFSIAHRAPSQHAQAGGFEHLAGADQREADQCRWVVAVDAVQQGDAQSLTFRASRAVVRWFDRHIGFDLGVGQVPEFDPNLGQGGLRKPGIDANDRHSGLKHDRLATHPLELFNRAGMVSRFAKGLSVQVSHLIGADDHGLWTQRSDGVGLFLGQSDGQAIGGLVALARFVHIGRNRFEWMAQPFQKQATVWGCGRQDERAWFSI